MKRITLVAFLIVFLTSAISYAQTEEGAYLNIDYLKVDISQNENFEMLSKSTWIPVLEEELKKDGFTGGFLYRVKYPGGNSNTYNYAFMRTYKSIDQALASQKEQMQALAKNGKAVKQLQSMGELQYSELWKTEAGIMDSANAGISTFLVMNFMRVKPGMESQYLALENDIARPLHIERINRGMMHNWRTFSIIMPSGIGYNYNFVTADFYDDVNNIQYEFSNDILKAVMPGANYTKTMNAIYNTRDIMRSELWELVYYVN